MGSLLAGKAEISYYQLYDEVPSCKRSRKSTKPNVGFQKEIATTPIRDTGACRILNSAKKLRHQ
ncbi:hypothetical protein MAR_032089 [Mya arenaria]|uniref:Uncharacterized protein n=1 Tax=Mya arenaria TaxID=6604 RepID=A0ABY7F5N1_MYAAR|nr:hypothetical protein MAR_032089 [Mya arenaria]